MKPRHEGGTSGRGWTAVVKGVEGVSIGIDAGVGGGGEDKGT